MHHKLKIQLVALLATMTGTALGTCQAMQTNADSAKPVDNRVVQPAEPTYQGAFGAVKMAQPIENVRTDEQLPPIVSPNDFANDPAEQPMVLPPIVKPFDASNHSPQVEYQERRPLPTMVQSDPEASAQANAYNGLMPMTPLPTAPSAPAGQTKPEMSTAFMPAPIIQADTTPVALPGDANIDQAFQWNQPVAQGQGVSSAGIPLYSKASPTSFTAPQDTSPQHQVPPIVQGSDRTTSVFVPTQSVGSDIQPQFGRSTSIPMDQSNPTPPFIDPNSTVVSPRNTLPVIPPTQTGITPIVMPNSPMRQTSAPISKRPAGMAMQDQDPSYFAAPPAEAPVINSPTTCDGCGGRGCPECGVTGAVPGDVAACQSCGPGGCFNGSDVEQRFNASGSIAGARRYLIVDAMYLDRYDGTIAVSNFGGLNNFEDELFGARVTFGRREDCVHGDEFGYFGSAKLAQSATYTDAAGRISAGYPSTGPFSEETTAFRNATEQSQFKQTTFQSIEYNRNDWGWDVIRTFWGVRYIYVQDEFSISSRNLDDETGQFDLMTFNNMLGPQFGYEFFWDVGYRLSWSTVTKFGLFANPNQVNTQLFNAGAQFLDLKDNNTSFAGCIDFGLQGHYKISENARFRFGYNALYLSQVAGASDNVPTTISPTTGSDTSDSGQMFFHGIGFGFEVFR